jgi:hypothetical protein
MAAILDPISYNQKNAGVPANVVVGRKSLFQAKAWFVRTSSFHKREVWYSDVPGGVSGHNFGDNRGFNPNAGPATGEARTGSPTVAAAQRPDGTLYLRYQAVDPFSPGGETLGKLSPWSVNETS